MFPDFHFRLLLRVYGYRTTLALFFNERSIFILIEEYVSNLRRFTMLNHMLTEVSLNKSLQVARHVVGWFRL